MGNFGIGLGAFAEGLANGIRLGSDYNKAQYEKSQLEKAQKDQKANETFDAESQQQFDAGVKEGRYKPDDLTNFLVQYRGPQKAALLMQQGDYQGAKLWKDWYTSEAAQRGTQLFGTALLKAQTGDVSGAIDTAVEAAHTKGYLDHSYTLGAKDPIKDDQGNITGYRVHLKNTGGDDLQWDVTRDNVESGITSFFNPEAAYQSRLDAKKSRDKAKLELETYGTKKGIDEQYAQRDDARKLSNSIALEKEKRKLGTGGAGEPANVREAEWLAPLLADEDGRTGKVTNADRRNAYKQVRAAKNDSAARTTLITRVYSAMKSDTLDTRSDEEKWNAAEQRVTNSVSKMPDEGDDAGDDEAPGLGGGKRPALGGKQAGANNPAPGLGDKKQKPAPKPKVAQPSALPVPPDLAKKKDGTVVADENGQRYVKQGDQLIPQPKQ